MANRREKYQKVASKRNTAFLLIEDYKELKRLYLASGNERYMESATKMKAIIEDILKIDVEELIGSTHGQKETK